MTFEKVARMGLCMCAYKCVTGLCMCAYTYVHMCVCACKGMCVRA